jgi:YidC/Oxa1 family membrane protein insertase
MDKNTIIAIALIFFILMIFQFVFLRPRMEEMQRQAQQPEQVEPGAEEPGAEGPEEPAASDEDAFERDLPEALPAGSAEAKTVTIETELFKVDISTAAQGVPGCG